MFAVADRDELVTAGFPDKMAMELPYFDRDGKPTGFKRWRYLEETREGFALKANGKPLRYVQPGDTVSEVYMPPIGVNWRAIQADTSQWIIITEGELKAAYCTRHVVPCIGLGGVWSFKSVRRKLPLLPVFYDFKWAGREVVLAFDSDTNTNHLVLSAQAALCKELLALGALPYVAMLEPAEDGSKRGLDDIGLQEGHEAVRQYFEYAQAYATAAALYDLNAEVAYIRDPGIVVTVATGLVMRPSDFTGHAYANRHYYEEVDDAKGNPKMVLRPAALAWLKWPARYELAKMAYTPGGLRVTEDSEYNTWQGWGIEPKRGDIKPWKQLLDHLFEGKQKERLWFERWCALPLQNPGAKMYSAAVIWGINTGTGKSLTGVSLGRIYGKNYATIGDRQLQDSRNAWAINKQFALGDDVTGHDQRKYADRLKAMITQETMHIDQKYVPEYDVVDHLNYLFSSNHPDAFFLEDDDRRFFVHEVSGPPMPRQFYLDYMVWLDEGGAAALFYHLLKLDLGGMMASDRAPDTESKRSMVEDGLSDIGHWIRRLRNDPSVVLRVGDAPLAGDLWASQDLIRLYDPDGRGRATAGGLGKEAKRAGLTQAANGMPIRTVAGQLRLFAIRNVEHWAKAPPSACATHYDQTRGGSSGRRPRKV